MPHMSLLPYFAVSLPAQGVLLASADTDVVNYLLVKHHDTGAAIPILVIYFLLFILMTASFIRLVHITICDPPYLPLGPSIDRNRKTSREKSKVRREENGIATGEYDPGGSSGGT